MALRFIVDRFTQQTWDDWCKCFASSNLYQSWDYGEVHCRGVGRTISRAALLERDRPVALAQFRIKEVPFLRIGVAEANWGPLWQAEELLSDGRIAAEFLQGIRDEYLVRRGLDLQFEPVGRVDECQNTLTGKIFISHGFAPKSNERAYRTSILDLGDGMESLRARLNGKWRNSLNNAEKAGLEAEYGDSVEHFDRFHRIYDEMWAQKKFSTGVRMDALRLFQQRTAQLTRLRIWILKDHGTDVAAGVFSGLGDTMLYFLGASTRGVRKNTNPGYLIQWLSIRKAVELGFRWYDLGGLTDEPESSVDLFKVRMGGTRVMFPGWFGCSERTSKRRLYEVMESGYRGLSALVSRR